MACANIALVLLAAGAATRFGGRKLEAQLHGEMLGLVSAARISETGFGQRFAVCNPGDTRLISGFTTLGFVILDNPDAAAGMSCSVRLAAQAVDEAVIDGLLICLADMPGVTAAHIAAMLGAFEASDRTRTIASTCDGVAMPPALFARSAFPALKALSGSNGARLLLSDAIKVAADARVLADIDTPDDLARFSRPDQVNTLQL